MAKNVIELNGKRYDALTGEYLGAGKGEPYKSPSAAATEKAAPKKPKLAAAKAGPRHIDGFIRPGGVVKPTTKSTVAAVVPAAKPIASHPVATKHVAKAPHAHKPVMAGDIHKKVTKPAAVQRPVKAAKHTEAAKPAAKPAVAAKAPVKKPIAVRHTATTTAKPHSPQPTKTLMRRAVKKPEANLKPAIRTQVPVEIAPASPSSLLFKPSASRIDEGRLKRAKAIAKATGIQHFMPVQPDYTPTAFAAAPQTAAASIPVIPVRTVPAHAHGKLTTHKPKPASHQAHSDIFEAAIARANSHKQPKHPAKRSAHRRLVNTMAGIAAFLVIGGFITYLNLPNITLHVASVQAGFKAEMPDYRPTGYALQGGVQRSGNTVSLRFQSGENQYTLTQQPSVWNSQTLEENTLALAGSEHKTIDAAGRTVFIYNGSNAVWVNGGVRYDLTTNAPLSTEDISRLASSL